MKSNRVTVRERRIEARVAAPECTVVRGIGEEEANRKEAELRATGYTRTFASISSDIRIAIVGDEFFAVLLPYASPNNECRFYGRLTGSRVVGTLICSASVGRTPFTLFLQPQAPGPPGRPWRPRPPFGSP